MSPLFLPTQGQIPASEWLTLAPLSFGDRGLTGHGLPSHQKRRKHNAKIALHRAWPHNSPWAGGAPVVLLHGGPGQAPGRSALGRAPVRPGPAAQSLDPPQIRQVHSQAFRGPAGEAFP